MRRRQRKRFHHATLPLVALVDIFVNVLIFLLINVGDVPLLEQDRNITLPYSFTERQPDETLLVKVDAESISVDGRVVAKVPEVLAAQSDEIDGLRAVLAGHLARQPLSEAERSEGRAVTIMGDQQIPYRLLKRIMATCAQSEFRNIALAVNKKEPVTAGGVGA
jgi:biopolymer transport protein ExbD